MVDCQNNSAIHLQDLAGILFIDNLIKPVRAAEH